jgi:hypothetical protein
MLFWGTQQQQKKELFLLVFPVKASKNTVAEHFDADIIGTNGQLQKTFLA